MKSILSVFAVLASLSAQAKIVDLHIYQTEFDVARSANTVRINSATVKTIPSVVDQIENPDFDVFEGQPIYLTTVLKQEKVVQLNVSYEHNDAGELDGKELEINLPLSMFSEEELAGKHVARSSIKSKIALLLEERTTMGKETYCADPTFDDFNEGMNKCPKLATRPTTFTRNVLKVIKK